MYGDVISIRKKRNYLQIQRTTRMILKVFLVEELQIEID